MHELDSSQFSAAIPLFQQTHYGVLAYGTLEGGHPGRVFVDDPAAPSAGLVCTRVGYYFITGKPARMVGHLPRLFQEALTPAQLALTGDPQILLFYDPPAWQPALFSAFQDQRPRQIAKKRMVLSPGALADLLNRPVIPPEGVRLVPLTADLLQRHPARLQELLFFWGSVENFLTRGVGVWLMDGETVASSCEAVFTGAGEVEFSIGTAMNYRRRGLGRLVGQAFLQACLARGLKPVWGCWPENHPSVALARSLGFGDDCDQPICFFEVG